MPGYLSLTISQAVRIRPQRRWLGAIQTHDNIHCAGVKAGFARRDAEYLPLAIESLGRLASRIGW
jgi:hypothetical protein